MTITSFKVSDDKANLILNLSEASAATDIFIWSDKTYKYEGKKLDFSYKLNGAATQSITISLAEMELDYFDGVYFVEVIAPSITCAKVAHDLTRFKECIIDKISKQEGCVPCGDAIDMSVINAHTILASLEIAIEQGFIQEILTTVKALDKLCTNTCNNCGQYKNITSNNYFTFNITTE
jgi:hypothetical protein